MNMDELRNLLITTIIREHNVKVIPETPTRIRVTTDDDDDPEGENDIIIQLLSSDEYEEQR